MADLDHDDDVDHDDDPANNDAVKHDDRDDDRPTRDDTTRDDRRTHDLGGPYDERRGDDDGHDRCRGSDHRRGAGPRRTGVAEDWNRLDRAAARGRRCGWIGRSTGIDLPVDRPPLRALTATAGQRGVNRVARRPGCRRSRFHYSSSG